jgi:hypothetical protein
MKLYHSTTKSAATSILARGFRDGEGNYGLPLILRGVFVSDVPVDVNEGAAGCTLLEIDATLTENEIAQYELVAEPSGGYREWCIPADLLNSRGTITLADEGWE